MPNGLWERLRGARSIGIFVSLALAALLALSAVDGAGRVRAMVLQDENGAITGAVVVAEGLEDVSTWLKLQGAVMTLLGLEAERVEIIGGRFGGG